tara:strand:- start:31359 stop:33089 length:1731 start_codon:yes stop_codon:yes gene_type:complete
MLKNTMTCFDLNTMSSNDFKELLGQDLYMRFKTFDFEDFISVAERGIKKYDENKNVWVLKTNYGTAGNAFLPLVEYFYCLLYKNNPSFNLNNFQNKIIQDPKILKNDIRNFYNNGEYSFDDFNKKLSECRFENGVGFTNEPSTYFENIKKIFSFKELEEESKNNNIDVQDFASINLQMLWSHDGNNSTKSNSVNGNTGRKFLNYSYVDIKGLTKGKSFFNINFKHSDLMNIKTNLTTIEKIQAIATLILMKKNKNSFTSYENAIKNNASYENIENNILLTQDPDIEIFKKESLFKEYCDNNGLDFNSYSFAKGQKGITNKIFFNKKTKEAYKKKIEQFKDGFVFKTEDIKEELQKTILGFFDFVEKHRQPKTDNKKKKEGKIKSIDSKEWIQKVEKYYGNKKDYVHDKMKIFSNHYDTTNYPTLMEHLFSEVFEVQDDIVYSQQECFEQIVKSRSDIIFTKNGIKRVCDVKAFNKIDNKPNDILKMQEYLFACNRMNGFNNKTWGFFALMSNKWSFEVKDSFTTSCRDQLKAYKLQFDFIELIEAIDSLISNNDKSKIKILSDKVFNFFKDSNLLD